MSQINALKRCKMFGLKIRFCKILDKYHVWFSIVDILVAVPTMRARDRTVVTAADAGTGFSENAIIYLLLVGVGPRTNLSRVAKLSSARHQVKGIFWEIQKVELGSHATSVSPRRGTGILLLWQVLSFSQNGTLASEGHLLQMIISNQSLTNYSDT